MPQPDACSRTRTHKLAPIGNRQKRAKGLVGRRSSNTGAGFQPLDPREAFDNGHTGGVGRSRYCESQEPACPI